MRQALIRRLTFVLLATLTQLHCSAFSVPDPSPSRDASADVWLEDSGVGDGAASDAGCVPPAAPTHPCFTTGSCAPVSIDVTTLPKPDGFALKYPHEPVRAGAFVYFAAQEATDDGRNRNGRGYIYRVDAASMANPRRITALQTAPAWLAANDGFLYWRVKGPDTTSELRRVALEATDSCPNDACAYEVVTNVSGASIEQILPVSSTEVYVNFGGTQLLRVARASTGWETPEALAAPGPNGRLSTGSLAFWIADDADAGGPKRVFALGGPERLKLAASWTGTPAVGFIASACTKSYLYDSQSAPFLYDLLHDDNDGGVAPVACTKECVAPSLVFALSVDEKLAYIASPNAGDIRAVPLGGGPPVILVPGDMWNVINDDDAVYYANINGARVGRIAKR